MAVLKTLPLGEFIGGLAPSLYLSGEGQYQAGAGIDPITEPGILKPGYGENSLKTNFGTHLTKMVASGTLETDRYYVYGISESFICRIDLFDNAVTENATFVDGQLAITGTDPGSLNLYRGNFYFGNRNTSVGRFTPGATPTLDTNFLGSGFTASTYRPLHPFQDVLWIGNGNSIALYDGTRTMLAALDLETGYEIDHIGDIENLLVFTAGRFSSNPSQNLTTGCLFGLWDANLGTRPIDLVNIPGETRIRGIKKHKGKIHLLGENGLYEYNGYFNTLVRFNTSFYTGNSNVTRGSTPQSEALESFGDYLLWAGASVVNFYGRPDPRLPFGIFQPISLSSGNIGAIFGGKDNQVVVAGTGSVSLANYTSGGKTGVNVDTKRINFGKKVKIHGLRLRFKASGAGASLDVNYRFRAGTGEGAVSLTGVTSSDGSISEKFMVPNTAGSYPVIDHCYFRITFNTAVSIIPGESLIFYEEVPDDPYMNVTPQVTTT